MDEKVIIATIGPSSMNNKIINKINKIQLISINLTKLQLKFTLF